MLFLHMLRSAPIETHDLDTEKRHGLTLIIHMAKLVISMMFNTIVVGILVDSLGPDGSFVSSFLSHDDVLIDHLGKILVSMMAVTAAGMCLLICSLVPEEPINQEYWERYKLLLQYLRRQGYACREHGRWCFPADCEQERYRCTKAAISIVKKRNV